MFISTKYSGYNRHGEQAAAGQFLILMQPDMNSAKYPAYSANCQCGKTREQHSEEQKAAPPDCPEHGMVGRLHKLTELKGTPEYEAARDAVAAMKPGHRHVAGCPQCDVHTEYHSVCRWFRAAALSYPLRAIVRYVRMRQLGHFMMGSARVGKTRLTLSGSYGSDGLPKTVPDEVYEAGTPLPQSLYDAWNKGGGWNSAGAEAPAMRQWAKQNLIHNTGRVK
jgi:hypothetical protein